MGKSSRGRAALVDQPPAWPDRQAAAQRLLPRGSKPQRLAISQVAAADQVASQGSSSDLNKLVLRYTKRCLDLNKGGFKGVPQIVLLKVVDEPLSLPECWLRALLSYDWSANPS